MNSYLSKGLKKHIPLLFKCLPQIKRPGNQGFTLIELIVVISIVSILLAFSIPRLDTSFFSDKERKLSAWILLNVKQLKEKAVKEQTLQVLNIDLDTNEMWASVGPMGEDPSDKQENPRENAYQIPKGFHIMDVEFLNQDKISKGITGIQFYKKGYSDKALIHIEDKDNVKYSYLIAPFLPHVKIMDSYVTF